MVIDIPFSSFISLHVGQLLRQNLHLQCQSSVRCLVGSCGNYMSLHVWTCPSWPLDTLGATFPKTSDIAPENRPGPKRKGSSSNHSFSGARAVSFGQCSSECIHCCLPQVIADSGPLCHHDQAASYSDMTRDEEATTHALFQKNIEIHQPVDKITNLIIIGSNTKPQINPWFSFDLLSSTETPEDDAVVSRANLAGASLSGDGERAADSCHDTTVAHGFVDREVGRPRLRTKTLVSQNLAHDRALTSKIWAP